MTIGDMIVLAVLALVVGGILAGMERKRKTGNSCGCGSCQGCAMAGKCCQK